MASWYNDTKLVEGLGQALASAEVLESPEEFKLFLSRPQIYNTHFEAWQNAGYPVDDGEDGWDEFVDAISESDEEDEEDESDET